MRCLSHPPSTGSEKKMIIILLKRKTCSFCLISRGCFERFREHLEVVQLAAQTDLRGACFTARANVHDKRKCKDRNRPKHTRDWRWCAYNCLYKDPVITKSMAGKFEPIYSLLSLLAVFKLNFCPWNL